MFFLFSDNIFMNMLDWKKPCFRYGDKILVKIPIFE